MSLSSNLKNTNAKRSKTLMNLLDETSEYSNRSMYLNMIEHMRAYLNQEIVDRESYYLMLSKYRDNWIVNGIYDILLNDILVDNGMSDYIRIFIEKGKGKLQEEAERLFKKLNIADLLQAIVPEMLHYGSYPLKIVSKPGEGVIGIIDDTEPAHIISVNDSSNRPLFYFVDESVHDPRTNAISYNTSRRQYRYYDITQVLYFSLNLGFVKLPLPEIAVKSIYNELDFNKAGIRSVLKMYYDIDHEGNKKVVAKKKEIIVDNPNIESEVERDLEDEFNSLIPSVLKIRTSTSFLHGVLDKIKDTLLLNKIAVYSNLAALLAPKLVGIPLPDEYDPVQTIETVQKYNTLLNSDISRISFTDSLDSLNLSEVVKTKCVPIVGTRSEPRPLDYGVSANTIDSNTLNENLKETLNSLGIPAELFDGEKDSKSNLRTNVRYAKKIKKIQKNICRALKGLLLLHFGLKYPNIEVYDDDIDIQLKNNVNFDELENMEANDLVISATQSIIGLLNTITEFNNEMDQDKPIDYSVDYSELVKATKQMLEAVGSPFTACIKENRYIKEGDKLENPVEVDYIQDINPEQYSADTEGGAKPAKSSGENSSSSTSKSETTTTKTTVVSNI